MLRHAAMVWFLLPLLAGCGEQVDRDIAVVVEGGDDVEAAKMRLGLVSLAQVEPLIQAFESQPHPLRARLDLAEALARLHLREPDPRIESAVIEALRDPEPAASIALHAWPGRPAGSIGSCPGPAMAAAEFFSITIRGRGGHGCRPHDTIDPIVTAARVVDALQTVVSRNLDPLKPAVVSVCQLHAGTTANVIPETASIEGTIRYLEPHVGRDIIRHMQQLIKGVCDSTGATFEWQCDNAYIPTVNSEPVVNLGKRVTRMTLGEDAWFDVQVPSMGGEDFAFYLVDHPGALFRIGMGSASAPLHSPQFNFNDDAIRHGILFLATMALDVLNHGIDENS